jgi:EAL domain-containing protein (putative c-di-GMP-specific phosphodiesterase class I)
MLCSITKLAPNHVIFVSLRDVEQAPCDNHNEALGKLIILSSGDETPLSIPVQVNHHTRERWTLEPRQGTLPLLMQLKGLLQQPPTDSETTTERLTPYRRSELFRDCQKIVDDFLHARLVGFFSEVDDQLLRAAATERSSQQAYQAAINTASSKQEAFESTLKKRILALLAAAAEPDFTPIEPDFSQISTHAARPPTPRVNLYQLAKHAATSNQAALDSLALHFSLVVRHLSEPAALPFGPAWLCRHFGDTLITLQVPEETHPLLHQVFRDTILANISLLLGRLDSFFCAQNTRRVTRQNDPPVLHRHAPAHTATGVPRRATQSPTLRLPRPEPEHAGILLHAASDLQRAISGHHDRESSSVAAANGSTTERVITKEEIKVLSKVFDDIIGARRVLDEARPLLRQIKAPLLTLASSNIDFWDNGDLPARRCLNLIALLCEETYYRGGPVRRRLPSICERIQREWKVNGGIFSTVLPLLEELVSRQQQASERNVQRLAAKSDGQYRRFHAQIEISTQLRQRFDGRPFPVELQRLIDQGWHRFMVHALINHGHRSDTYKQCLDTLEQLYQTLVMKGQSVTEHPPIIFTTQRLADEFLKPLEAIGLSNVQYQTTLRQLGELLQQSEAVPAMAPDFRAEPVHHEQSQDPVATPIQSLDEQLLPRGRDNEGGLPILPGEWLGWIDCPGEQPMQLAWSAPDQSRHVFVDEAGKHLFDMTEAELATDRHHGLQRMIAPSLHLPLEACLYQTVARSFTTLARRFEQPADNDLLGPNAFEAELAQLIKFASYSGQSHSLIGLLLTANNHSRSPDDAIGEHHNLTELRAVATVLQQTCPSASILARLETGYYAIILPYSELDTGKQLTDKVRNALQHLDTTNPRYGLIAVTQHSSSPSNLLTQLRASCSRTEQYIPSSNGAATTKTPGTALSNWTSALGKLLEQNRLKIRVQGSVAIGAAQQSHYEILLGVVDDQGRVTLPGELIAAAEQHHRMDIVDRWIVQHTFRWLQTHPKKAQQLGCVHINLSGNALQNKPFMAFLLTELERGALPNDALSFEICETTASANLPRAADFIARVRATGCHFALDHFGKGPGSIELLGQLPIDMVKIDRRYTRSLANNEVSRILLSSLAEAAHSLGITTFAQGVENEAVLQSLESLKIDYAQGFGVSKPVLLDEA